MTTELDEPDFAQNAREQYGGAWHLERAVRLGAARRLRRGAYVDAERWTNLDPLHRHLVKIAAARRAARTEPVFSHESAAALHGIPFIGNWPESVHVSVPPGRAASNSAVVRSRRMLAEESIVALPTGARATDPVTTALDLAATRSLLSGIVAISHLRHEFGMTREELERALAESGIRSGVRKARLAIARSTAGSESVLESLVVARCEDLGFAAPTQQLPVTGVDGRQYRVDFAWCDGRIIAEGDGRGKYHEPEQLAGRTAEEALWAEKRREDAIRPTCERFVRFTWSDAWNAIGLERVLAFAGVPRPHRVRPLTR